MTTTELIILVGLIGAVIGYWMGVHDTARWVRDELRSLERPRERGEL